MRDSLSPVNIASAMFPGASQPAPTHLPLRLPWYPHSVTPSAETVFKPPTAQHQQWWWQRLIGRAQPHIPVQITYSPQPRWWPARLQLKSAYQPLSSSPSSTWLYNRPTTREIVVSATVVFIVSVAVVVLLGLFVLPGPSSSTTSTPYGPPISKPFVFVAPQACGTSVSVASATPLFAMPLVNDTVDLVSGQSIVTSSNTPLYARYSWRNSSLYLQGSDSLTLSATITSATAFSYCFWFYISGYSGAGLPMVMLGSADANRMPTMCLGVNQVGVFFLGRGTADGQCTCPPGSCTALAAYNAPLYTAWGPYLFNAGNQWHWSFVCYVYGSQTASIYINGTLASSTPVDFDNAVTGTPIGVGPFLGGVSNQFLGGIQCLSGYDAALNANQIISMRVNQMDGCATLASFSTFNCLAPAAPSPATPVFLTGATEITPIPPFTLPVRNPSSYRRTFYVSQVYGDDDNDGLSPGSAWQTLANVRTQTAVQPGDSYLFCNGDNQYSPSRGINFFYNAGNVGDPSLPVTLGNYTCNEAFATQRPLLSMGSRLPQVTGVIGWTVADWTYADGTVSSTVLSYNLTQLRTMEGGTNFLEDSGLGPSVLWINGTMYTVATEPNWLNPLIQTGQAVQEFLWYDAFYSEVSTSYMGWSSGSLCASLFYGLYGGNAEKWQSGAGGVHNYYTGVQAQGRFFTFAYSFSESVIEEWIPADFSCQEWYEEYVTQAGYDPPLGPLDPSTYLYLFAQNKSDPHFSDPYWQPPRVAPNIYSANGGAYNVPFSDQYGNVLEWGGGVKLTGHSEFLNAPGEYWYNSVTGILSIEPYPEHTEILLTTFTKQQVPFTMLAATSLGFNSAPAVLLQGQGDQPGIVSANGYAGFTGNFVIHDLELAYGTCALNLGAVVYAEVYNLYVHDIGVAVNIVGDSTAAAIAFYNTAADRVLGSCYNIEQTAINTNLLNLSCANVGVSAWATYVTGISVSGSNPVVVRGCTVSNVTGNSNGNNGIFLNTGAGSVAEFNTVTNSSLVLFDSGALFAGGNFRYNEVNNVVMNRIMGYIGPTGVANADAVYASNGAIGSWSYNLLANVSGACFFVAGFAASSFTNNLCVNAGTSNLYPVQYSDTDTAQVQGHLAEFDNNWVLFDAINYTSAVYPFQEPFIPQRTVYLTNGSVWGGPGVYSPPQWSPVVPFPFYLRSLYGIPFVKGAPGSTFMLEDWVVAMYGNNPELLIAVRNSVWQTEQMFALSTDQYTAGLQYGRANVQAVTAAAIADLRAHNSKQRAATEQQFVTDMLRALPWYQTPS
jgi:hypothetical protein